MRWAWWASARTYVCMEGAVSTRAESNLYRSWARRDRMTNLQEAKLARERRSATRRWHGDRLRLLGEGHDDVTWSSGGGATPERGQRGQGGERVAAMPRERGCVCASALKYAILTDRKRSGGDEGKLSPILGKYL